MTPDDIRRLYRGATAATDAEAAATHEAIRTDPGAARAFLQALYSISVEDVQTALLLKLFLEGMLMRLVEERAAADDAFALEAARLATDLMGRLARPPRGRPGRNVKTA